MNCDACQVRLIELLDDGREAATDTEVSEHLDGCAECQRYSATLHQLDRFLSHRAEAAVLPDGFKETLMASLPEQAPRLLPAEIAQRRRELEAEHRNALAMLRRRFLIPSPALILRSAAVLGGFVFAGLVAERLFRALADAGPGSMGFDWALRGLVLGVSIAAGTLFMVRRTFASVLGQFLRAR